MIYLLLIGFIKRYIQENISIKEFEDLVVSQLEGASDSGDQRTITLSEAIDSLLIERQEGLFTEEEVRRRLVGLIHEPLVLRGSSNTAHISERIFSSPIHRITWTPSSAAAGR